MSQDQVLVSIDALTKSFPGSANPAVNDLTVQLWAGKMTGVAGPDGAGKTTLLRLIASLMHPDQGRITIKGLDSVKEALTLQKITGYMPQKFGLYDDLSVRENLTLYADLRGIAGDAREEKFARLLAFTNLVDFQGRLAGQLSGGMKQKLGLACALLGDPQLLILDEPSVGVDPVSRQELWAMVQELLRKNMSVLWATSYLDEAEKCDHVILLDQGKSLFTGEPRGLLKIVDACCYRITGLPKKKKRAYLADIARIDQVIDSTIQGETVRIVISKKEERDRVEAGLHGLRMNFQKAKPRFEDAYIKMLGGFYYKPSALAASMQAKQEGPQAVIEAKNLVKCYGDFTAVNHLSFSIERGEVFGLLGPNGAGKSTTFKMLCGLLSPTQGKASVMGLDLQKSSGMARSRIGYMAQKFSLYGNLSSRQNLDFFSGVYGLSPAKQKQQIEAMIQIFNLSGYLKSKTAELPLGIKQRLALACAVMHEPDILFLDEPTSGVDPITRREFWMHINGMVDKGVTIMVTTHFMEEAEYCDRIALIYRGNNIAQGSPDALKAEVRTSACPDPSLEDAFIQLVKKHDASLQSMKGQTA